MTACPFCSHTKITVGRHDPDAWTLPTWTAQCLNCMAQGPPVLQGRNTTDKQARERAEYYWNRRKG